MFGAKSNEEFNDALPSKEEKELIYKLRSTFKEEFANREAEGRDFPCFFGELALTRVLRGNDGDLESVTKWFTIFLDTMREHDVDSMVTDLSEVLDESGSDFCSSTLLPFHEEVAKYFNVTLTAPELTPSGDVIQYIPMVDFDKRGIVDEVEWSHWVQFNRSVSILRCLECDRLSRKQGRMVRCITIVDVGDCSMDTLFFGSFDRDNEEDVNRFVKQITIEIMGSLYVVNPTWKLSTLFGIVRRFAPEKMIRKIHFQRGDPFNDSDFVALVGGKDQLEYLFASRLGLTQNLEGRESEEYVGEPDALATDREQELIAMLRDEFKEEFGKRAEDETLHPFFFGDIALTRVVRGNHGSYRAAVKWLRGFLQKLEDWDVDALVRELREQLENAESPLVPEVTYLPYQAEIHNFFRVILSAPRPTPAGDIVFYMALSDVDREALLNGSWDNFVRFSRAMALLNIMVCDQQSNIQGRLVRTVNIWDFSGIGISSLRHPEWDEAYSRDIGRFIQHVCIETAGPQYVVNAPWLLASLFNVLGGFMPEKLTRKFHIRSDDGTSDREFVELVGGMEQLQELLASRVGLCDDAEDQLAGEQDIAAGDCFEKFQDIKEGQRVSWMFTVIAGYVDSLFGVSDVEFSATFFSVAELAGEAGDKRRDASTEEVDDYDGLELVAPSRYTPAQVDICGSHVATRNGYILFRWSNEHSAVRGKTINYSVEVEEATDDFEPESRQAKTAPEITDIVALVEKPASKATDVAAPAQVEHEEEDLQFF